ncbi:MAG TPA: hypothetical protein VFW22_10460 [Pseudolabrys sp.]|nr:hypothetical protein [Pseudolabrys sp.]
MHRSVKSVVFSAILAGMALGAPAAKAAVRDGIWSVLIITEKGECDRGYRYEVKVANGHISSNVDSAINLAGTVTPDGATKVSIKAGDKGASGTGRLSGRSGAGVWHGFSATGACAGRWEAELK